MIAPGKDAVDAGAFLLGVILVRAGKADQKRAKRAQRVGFGQPVGLFGEKRCQDTAKHVRDISRLSGFRKARVFNNAGAAL